MKFKNGYNFMYEKVEEGKKELYVSKAGKPSEEDKKVDVGLTDAEIKDTKLVYVKDESLVASVTGIPTDDDKAFEPKADGEVILG